LRTRAALGDTAVEVRNQVDYYAARCVGVDTIPPAPSVAQGSKPHPASDTATKRSAAARSDTRDTLRRRNGQPDKLRADSIRQPSHRDSLAKAPRRQQAATAPNDTKNGTKRFTVQVAAYDTKAAAEQLMTRLAARDIVARVVTAGHAPYRVRIGRYATDEEATAAARELKKKGIEGFVTTTDNEAASAPAGR
jgi:cell division protein FtsN